MTWIEDSGTGSRRAQVSTEDVEHKTPPLSPMPLPDEPRSLQPPPPPSPSTVLTFSDCADDFNSCPIVDPLKSNQSGRSLFKQTHMSSAAKVALAALQCLPVPLLVLSSLKRVLLANDSMGRLLGLDQRDALRNDMADGESPPSSSTDVLAGQSLSQIGIDMLQDGQPIWVSWELFLDRLADDLDKHQSAHSKDYDLEGIPGAEPGVGDATPIADHMSEKKHVPPQLNRNKSLVQDAVVDVVLSSQYIGMCSSSNKNLPSSSNKQVQAKMIISIWNLDGQRFFTLTFTSSSPTFQLPPRPHSRAVARIPSSFPFPSPSGSPATSPTASCQCSHYASTSSPPYTPPPTNVTVSSTFLPMAGPALSTLASTPSILQKITRMKDAILGTMKIPVFAMWKDESITVPNLAGLRLLAQDVDPLSQDGYDFISRFRIWTEDFSRELEVDEYPIVELVRTQKPFVSRKIGMREPDTGRRISFDCQGEGIVDEKTGEWLAGLIWCRDVTEYKEKMEIQTKRDDQRFEMICDTMPQMVRLIFLVGQLSFILLLMLTMFSYGRQHPKDYIPGLVNAGMTTQG
jgi:hypothetical protein